MIKLEAARAICEMKDTTSNEIYPAISGKKKKKGLDALLDFKSTSSP
jgi:hypothetical protein